MTQATTLERTLNCDKSVFIQACAGAGKTFALTKRYAAILDDFAKAIENGADPGSYDHKQILVITFTKKATGEMNRRIYEDVKTLLSGNEINEFKGTEFCNVLITSKNKNVREFTERLKDTFSQNSISTIDSFCAGILREFAYKLNLDPQFLSQDEHDTKKLLNETIDNWISEKLIFSSEYFNDLLEEFSFYEIKEILKSMYGSREVLDNYIKYFDCSPIDEIWRNWLINYLPDADVEMLSLRFDSIWTYAKEYCINKADKLFVMLESMNNDFQQLDRSGDPLEYRAAFLSILRSSTLFTSNNEYRVSVPGAKANWKEGKGFAEDWFDLLKKTDAKEIQMSPGPQDKKIIPILKDLIIKFKEFNEYFSEIRKKRDLLDFSDIIILTHRLLEKHADVRNILGKRYRHIMLDEFQDTNPLRWQIIEMILNAGNDIKLFIVGDRKQSIYRFNNADVTVMDTAQEVVNALGGDNIDFNDNYRSSDKFINEAINPLMTDILKKPDEDREKYEAVFENTESPKNKEGIKETTIERIWCEHTGEDEEYIPAFHTAYQVKRLLENYEHSRIDEKPYEPLIGVLLRRGTKLSEYLQAFHKWRIPVSILGGKDFYTTPAVMDIFYFLSVLDNPLDDHALIGLLRSPFFALSDPAINKLAHRGKNSVFDTMSSYPELQHVYHEILIWKELSKTMALDELIAKVIDSEDRELGYVSELMPEQQLANFDKALNIIRGLQRSGSSLHEIREFLHYQISTKADEPQAIYPTKARVQILTVHKAKGLEFPVVVIPEMNTKGNSDKNKFRYGRSHGHPEISLSLSDDEKPGLLTRLKEITKNEEDAEDKRVFYVAVTRAIHKVVLLGEGEKALANSWWAKYTLNLPNDPDKDDLLRENWPSNVKIINKNTVIAPTDRKNIETLPWKNRTQFDEPGKYLYRSPHDLMGESDGFNGGSGSAHGAVYGDLFHACMERGWLDARHHNNEIRSFVSNRYPDLSQEELMAKLTPWLGTVRSHELADIILDPAIEKYPEHKIKAWLGNGKDVMQVNGTIDLLYKNNDQWVILDYKTDADKHRLPAYRKQLQSYQWMVKQIYGIDAIAKIFFVSLNEIEEIKWNNSYFDELSFDGTFTPELPDSPMDISKLKSEIKAGKHLILCASAQHQEQVLLALSSEGSLRPDIKISTLSKFLQENCVKGISQDRLRLMIRQRNHDMKNGTADLLAKALRDEELKKGKIKSEFHQYLGDIKSAPEYRSAAEPYYQASADGQRILLLDVYAETELEKHLIQRLSHETEVLRLSLSPDKKAGEYTLLKSFSPREEALACAKHIKENRTRDEQVFIAVASMEKYAPHLERQFPEYGLRARFISPRSLYEVPCVNLLMNYLKLCSQDKKDKQKWSDLAPVLLHPIMKTKDLFYGFDKDIRKHPLDEGTVSESGLNICNKTSDLLENVRKFADSLKNDDDPDTCKACESFIKILEKVIVDLTRLDPKTDINTIYREMVERVKSESIPRRDQWNGIPVVGLLDSLGVHADKLYVLGMVEGDIPRQENDNPFLTDKRNHSLELNRHFMQEWKKLGNSVIFCTSIYAEDGSEQNRSSFLEGMSLNEIMDNGYCRRNELLEYDNKGIKDSQFALAERHQEILNKKPGIYSGSIGTKQNEFNISVTQVDTLLACPMKFYFDTVMKCSPIDQDETFFWGSKKGTVIHKSFESFIKAGGYEMDMERAIELMYHCLEEALEAEGIDKNDPRQIDHFRNYVKELYAGSKKNCLAINLEKIKAGYADYKKTISEKDFSELRFEHPKLDINLRGRIDKIMINEEENKLIASDFKTGKLTTTLLSKMMLSQLYLYLKYCAVNFPEYELKAMYEKLKKPDDCRMIEYMEIGDEFKQLGKNAKQSFVIEDFEKHLNDLFFQIADGKYYITKKEFKYACEYCPYAGLCRKDTRIKIEEN